MKQAEREAKRACLIYHVRAARCDWIREAALRQLEEIESEIEARTGFVPWRDELEPMSLRELCVYDRKGKL